MDRYHELPPGIRNDKDFVWSCETSVPESQDYLVRKLRDHIYELYERIDNIVTKWENMEDTIQQTIAMEGSSKWH